MTCTSLKTVEMNISLLSVILWDSLFDLQMFSAEDSSALAYITKRYKFTLVYL